MDMITTLLPSVHKYSLFAPGEKGFTVQLSKILTTSSQNAALFYLEYNDNLPKLNETADLLENRLSVLRVEQKMAVSGM